MYIQVGFSNGDTTTLAVSVISIQVMMSAMEEMFL